MLVGWNLPKSRMWIAKVLPAILAFASFRFRNIQMASGILEETKETNLGESSDHVIVVSPEDPKIPDVQNSVIVVERSPSLEETNVEISQRCFGCGKSAVSTDLDEEIIEVLNGIYHKVCFKCRHCKRLLSPDQFQVEDGIPCCAPQCDVIVTSHTKSWTPSSEQMESTDSMPPEKEQVSFQNLRQLDTTDLSYSKCHRFGF
ncbi:hypothetical protein EG68_09263 [Paragonimus skrjabini miyazakii]|uniref:LIM zinc-binding domain-containing protein n=1 Tax=Paragonimus skrjabini miyazakii TaxID=59628 RepID=A0A8S9YN19_9TREM|nr:hypothetical protein EG68_09263 [Paragonimus skrjabini miyazakii]